jgi:hypothetical protein
MIEIQWPAQIREGVTYQVKDGITDPYAAGWRDCLSACKNAVAQAIKKESTIGWDQQIEARYPLLSDNSPDGTIRAKIARAAFRQYDPTREWDQLNPQVREDWLHKIKAVMDALKHGLSVS